MAVEDIRKRPIEAVVHIQESQRFADVVDVLRVRRVAEPVAVVAGGGGFLAVGGVAREAIGDGGYPGYAAAHGGCACAGDAFDGGGC